MLVSAHQRRHPSRACLALAPVSAVAGLAAWSISALAAGATSLVTLDVGVAGAWQADCVTLGFDTMVGTTSFNPGTIVPVASQLSGGSPRRPSPTSPPRRWWGSRSTMFRSDAARTRPTSIRTDSWGARIWQPSSGRGVPAEASAAAPTSTSTARSTQRTWRCSSEHGAEFGGERRRTRASSSARSRSATPPVAVEAAPFHPFLVAAAFDRCAMMGVRAPACERPSRSELSSENAASREPNRANPSSA